MRNYNSKKNSHTGSSNNSFFGAFVNIISKGWESIFTPTNARCDAYTTQADHAREEMHRKDISKRERKYWSKQNDKAMNGLADVHDNNSNTLISICTLGLGILAGYKILKR